MNSIIRRLALDEAREAKRQLNNQKARDKVTLEKITACEICGSESEHVIRGKMDGIVITCDEWACMDEAHSLLKGGE